MPNMANIVVKKNDNTTDVTYVAKTPAGGDGIPAIWRNESVGNAPAHFPELRLSSRDASNGGKRHMRGTYVYPQIVTNSTTALTQVVDKAEADFNVKFPRGMSQVNIDEFVSQFANLIRAELIKDSNKSGFAPT